MCVKFGLQLSVVIDIVVGGGGGAGGGGRGGGDVVGVAVGPDVVVVAPVLLQNICRCALPLSQCSVAWLDRKSQRSTLAPPPSFLLLPHMFHACFV